MGAWADAVLDVASGIHNMASWVCWIVILPVPTVREMNCSVEAWVGIASRHAGWKAASGALILTLVHVSN